MEARIKKYKKFDPKVDKWGHDRRQVEDATNGLEILVAKNFSKYALPCIAIYPDVDLKTGLFRGFKVAAPDGPLKDYFNQEETKEVFFNLLRDATIDAMAKKNRKLSGEDVEAASSVIKTVGVTKPVRPIWSLTLKELESFFSNFKSEIAKDDGVKLKPKWPKIVDNVCVKAPTKIPTFDEVVERILPSNQYVPTQKFSLGNLHWRLKVVCAYLFLKKNLDINTFADEVPDNYVNVNFDMDTLVEFGNDIKASADEHHARKHNAKKKTARDAVRLNLDEDEDDENDPTPSPPRPATQQTMPTSPPATQPGTSNASCSRTIPVSVIQRQTKKPQSQLFRVSTPISECPFVDFDEDDDILDNSTSTGTPLNSSIGFNELENERVTRSISLKRSKGH